MRSRPLCLGACDGSRAECKPQCITQFDSLSPATHPPAQSRLPRAWQSIFGANPPIKAPDGHKCLDAAQTPPGSHLDSGETWTAWLLLPPAASPVHDTTADLEPGCELIDARKTPRNTLLMTGCWCWCCQGQERLNHHASHNTASHRVGTFGGFDMHKTPRLF